MTKKDADDLKKRIGSGWINYEYVFKAIDDLTEPDEVVQTQECPRCGSSRLELKSDYNFGDFRMEGDGIVKAFTCKTCGAVIVCCMPERGDNDVDQ